MAITQESTRVVKMTAVGDDLSDASGNIDVLYLYWSDKGGTADDDLLVTDSAGNTLWETSSTGSNYHEVYPLKNRVPGVKIATLTSGTLYVIRGTFHGGVAW